MTSACGPRSRRSPPPDVNFGFYREQAKPSASAPVEVGGLHYSPSGQVQTQSREQCLTQLDEARKRSPHGLAPEWEKTQKARCDGLYSEAASQ